MEVIFPFLRTTVFEVDVLRENPEQFVLLATDCVEKQVFMFKFWISFYVLEFGNL